MILLDLFFDFLTTQEKGEDYLQPSDDLYATDQWWGGDRSALHRRLVAVRLQSGFKPYVDHSKMG